MNLDANGTGRLDDRRGSSSFDEDGELSSSTMTPYHSHTTPIPVLSSARTTPSGVTPQHSTPSPKKRSTSKSPTKSPRKTTKLTDSDRRAICEHREANPAIKQDRIGILFGVERSTVSKILKNKEKWLGSGSGGGSQKESVIGALGGEQDGGLSASTKKGRIGSTALARSNSARSALRSPGLSASTSVATPTPGKSRGGRHPLLEEALSAWARDFIALSSTPVILTDDTLTLQAKHLAPSFVGCLTFKASPGWLEKFKQRARIRNGRFEEDEDSSPRSRDDRMRSVMTFGSERDEDDDEDEDGQGEFDDTFVKDEMDEMREEGAQEDVTDGDYSTTRHPRMSTLSASRRKPPSALSVSTTAARSKKTLSSSTSKRIIANLPSTSLSASTASRNHHIPPPTAADVFAELGTSLASSIMSRPPAASPTTSSIPVATSRGRGKGRKSKIDGEMETKRKPLTLDLSFGSSITSTFAQTSSRTTRTSLNQVAEGGLELDRRGNGGTPMRSPFENEQPQQTAYYSYPYSSTGKDPSTALAPPFSQDLSASFSANHLQSPFQSNNQALSAGPNFAPQLFASRSGANSPGAGMMDAIVGGVGGSSGSTLNGTGSSGTHNYRRHARSGSAASSSASTYSSLTAFTSQPSSGTSINGSGSSYGSFSLPGSSGIVANTGSTPSTPATSYFGHGPDGTQSQLQAAFLVQQRSAPIPPLDAQFSPYAPTSSQPRPSAPPYLPRRATVSGINPSFEERSLHGAYTPHLTPLSRSPTYLSQTNSNSSSPLVQNHVSFDHAYASLQTALAYLSTEGNDYVSSMDLLVLADLKGKMAAAGGTSVHPNDDLHSTHSSGGGGMNHLHFQPHLSLSPAHFARDSPPVLPMPSMTIPASLHHATSSLPLSTITRSGSRGGRGARNEAKMESVAGSSPGVARMGTRRGGNGGALEYGRSLIE